jgi:hypothetical protein
MVKFRDMALGWQVADMKNRGLQSLLTIFLVLMMTSGGIFAFFTSHDRQLVCQKSNSRNNGIVSPASGSCKVLPCNPGGVPAFILTDIYASRIERTDQGKSGIFDSFLIGKKTRLSCFLSQSEIYLLNTFLEDHPPCFIMNCSFLC